MRGFVETLLQGRSLASAVCGAALVLCATSSVAQEAGRAVRPLGAMDIVPVVARPGSGAVTAEIPRIFTGSDAELYRQAFALERRGRFAEVDQIVARLGDRLLVGHLMAERLLGPLHRSRPEELEAWLATHADHPDAVEIHGLLRRRSAKGAPLPQVPEMPALPDLEDFAVPEPVTANAGRDLPTSAQIAAVRSAVAEGDAEAALQVIGRLPISIAAGAHLRGEAALGAFVSNRDQEALGIARDAIRRSGDDALPYWAAGLASWRMGRLAEARGFFERSARAPEGTPALKAAAAFWAARAHLRTREPQNYVPWMNEAAQASRTFYGLLARRALGLSPHFAWDLEPYGASEAALLTESAGGLRALALIEIGEIDRAGAELERLAALAPGNANLGRAIMAAASQAGLVPLAVRLADLASRADGGPRDSARYPIPPFRPRGGYTVDPALLLALARQESNFDPKAVSPAGAIGLMQLMPATAAYVSGDASLAGRNRSSLFDPQVSLALGQRYLDYLARHTVVQGDLIRTLAAYNAGPGSLQRWAEGVRHQNDPLLFIEAIPASETRTHVRRVLANAWIYASRLGRSPSSLDSLAAGLWPRYDDLVMPGSELASRGAATQQ